MVRSATIESRNGGLDPLFMRFANRQAGYSHVREFMVKSASERNDRTTLEIVNNSNEYCLNEAFLEDFRSMLNDVIDSGFVNSAASGYLNDYMACLAEYSMEFNAGPRSVLQEKWCGIKKGDTPWVEAVICYNFALYVKAFGLAALKLCPTCSKFFNNHGQYAKYCSPGCRR